MEALDITAAVASIISSIISLVVLRKVNSIKNDLKNNVNNNRVIQKNNQIGEDAVGRDKNTQN